MKITKDIIAKAYQETGVIPARGYTFWTNDNGSKHACPLGVLAYKAKPSLIHKDGSINIDDAIEQLSIPNAQSEEIIRAWDSDHSRRKTDTDLFDEVRALRKELNV